MVVINKIQGACKNKIPLEAGFIVDKIERRLLLVQVFDDILGDAGFTGLFDVRVFDRIAQRGVFFIYRQIFQAVIFLQVFFVVAR
jgi:hypothetical protein